MVVTFGLLQCWKSKPSLPYTCLGICHIIDQLEILSACHFTHSVVRGLRAFRIAADFSSGHRGEIRRAPARRRRSEKIPRNESRPRTGKLAAQAWDLKTLTFVAFYYHPSLEVARAQWSV